MFKTISYLFVAVAFMNTALADLHTVYEYEPRPDHPTRTSVAHRFESASAPIREGFLRYKVELNIPYTYRDSAGVERHGAEKINIWFRTQGSARAFTAVMNSDRATDIYYNFMSGRHNFSGSRSVCASELLGLFCRDTSIEVVNYRDIEASDAFAFDAASGRNIPLLDYVGNHYDDGRVSSGEDHSIDNSARGNSLKYDLDPSNDGPRRTTTGAVRA
jgi:hypothetical protein